MQYQVVYETGNSMFEALNKLEKEIRDLSSEGWRPQGGVSIAVAHYDGYFVCQAMVK